MAEKDKKKDDKKKHSSHSKGGLPFGLEVLLFVVAVFILWVLTGGTKKEQPKTTPLFNPAPEVTPTVPTGGYSY